MNRGSNPITQLIGDSPDTFNDRTRLTKAATTIVLSLLSATALLALAGWFIASSAVAGLAVASTFSFLFPSAGVQALAWARTLARYGERITTHRATLELAATRVRTCLAGRSTSTEIRSPNCARATFSPGSCPIPTPSRICSSAARSRCSPRRRSSPRWRSRSSP